MLMRVLLMSRKILVRKAIRLETMKLIYRVGEMETMMDLLLRLSILKIPRVVVHLRLPRLLGAHRAADAGGCRGDRRRRDPRVPRILVRLDRRTDGESGR